METQLRDPYNSIIWDAGDVSNFSRLWRLLKSMPRMEHISLGRRFFETNIGYGWDLFPYTKERCGVKIFDNAMLVGEGDELIKLARFHIELVRPAMLSCVAGVISQESLQGFADLCHARGVAPCAALLLACKGEETIWDEYNQRTLSDQALWYADHLIGAGFTHLVCSVWEAEAIRRVSPELSLVVTLDAPTDSSARSVTPAEAFHSGAHQIVIGSQITDADNPPQALAAIAAEITPFL